VIFQVARCLNNACRNFDPVLATSGEAGQAEIAAWMWMLKSRD
jgi:hypothetical protein